MKWLDGKVGKEEWEMAKSNQQATVEVDLLKYHTLDDLFTLL
jgi:hypothetical protein